MSVNYEDDILTITIDNVEITMNDPLLSDLIEWAEDVLSGAPEATFEHEEILDLLYTKDSFDINIYTSCTITFPPEVAKPIATFLCGLREKSEAQANRRQDIYGGSYIE